MQARILIVEDDPDIARLVGLTLGGDGNTCQTCGDGTEALRLIQTNQYDLIILDVMLPGLDGFSLAETLRDSGALPPVLFLTARTEVAVRVRGLRLGAEDYLVKPFHPIELQARADAILRRHKKDGPGYRVLDVCLTPDTRQVEKAGQMVDLTPQEYELLLMLMRHQNMALSREQLLEGAWGYDYLGGTRTVDMHIQRLRQKLGFEQVIKTVYKLGYRLEVP